MSNCQLNLHSHRRKCGKCTHESTYSRYAYEGHESDGFMVMEVNWRSIFKAVTHVFWNMDFFFVYMDGHPQARVVLFPCSHLKQGFKEATMGITSCASSLFFCLFVCFLLHRA